MLVSVIRILAFILRFSYYTFYRDNVMNIALVYWLSPSARFSVLVISTKHSFKILALELFSFHNMDHGYSILSNDMQFTICTTRKPLFHDPHESWTFIYILSLSNDMQFTNCMTRKPLFHDPYELYGSWTCIYTQIRFIFSFSTKHFVHQRMQHLSLQGILILWCVVFQRVASDNDYTNCM